VSYFPPEPAHAARSGDPDGRHRGSGGLAVVGGARSVRRTLAALVSVAILVIAGYLWYTARGVDDAGKRLAGIAVGGSSTKTDIDGKSQNILLVGIDDRTNMTEAEVKALHVGRDGGSMATDTMMIVHIPADGSKATLISLPRDSYVPISGLGGDGHDKLNSAYAYGYNREAKADPSSTTDTRRVAGINLLLGTVANLTGLRIDHYIQVSLLGFYRISNAIGGVPIDLCQSVDDTAAYNRAHGETGGSGFKMTKGKHVIKGVTALEFVRQRHNFPNDAEDLDRVKRQQYFLTSAFRQVAKVGVVFKLNAIKNALQTSITADENLKLFSLAHQMANLSANNIVGKTIPTSNGESNDGQSVLIVNEAKVKTFIDNLINPPKTTAPTATASKAATPTAGATSTKAAAIDSKCVN
jgi:LCP family protein required for cell wall assembly